MTRRDGQGFTLVEVSVSMFLMCLVLMAVETVFVSGYAASNAGTQTAQMFRSAAIGFDEIGRELRLCDKIYYPDTPTLSGGYAPRQGTNLPFVFRRYQAQSNSEVAVGFTMNDQSHTFVRVVYDPAFDPAQLSTWTVSDPSVQILTLSQSVQSLNVTLTTMPSSDRFVQVDMASFPQAAIFPMESTLPIRGL